MSEALEGSIKDHQLPDVLQNIASEEATGRLVLHSGSRTGYVYLKDGQVVHAEAEDFRGLDAIHSINLWREGSFKFEEGWESPVRTVDRSITNIIIDTARDLDEWKVLSKKIPSVDLVPEFVPQASAQTSQISLSTREWVLLSKVDGARSIKEISEQAGLNTFQTCKIFYGLLTSGLLQLKVHPEGGAPSPSTSGPGTTAPQPKAAEPEPEPVDDSDATVETVVQRIHDISSSIMGRMGDAIIEKQLRKAGVKPGDTNLKKQVKYLRKALSKIQKAAAGLVGPEAAAQMVLQMEEEVDKLGF